MNLDWFNDKANGATESLDPENEQLATFMLMDLISTEIWLFKKNINFVLVAILNYAHDKACC